MAGWVQHQLYADNLTCVSSIPEVLLEVLGLLLDMCGWLARNLRSKKKCADEHVQDEGGRNENLESLSER